MVIGNPIDPIIPIGSVAMCIVLYLINAENEFSEFFDIISNKKKYRFSFDRKGVWGFSARIGSWFSVLSSKGFVFFRGECNGAQYFV